MRQGRISRRGLLGGAAGLGMLGAAVHAEAARAAPMRPEQQRVPEARPAPQLPARGEFVVRDAIVLTMDPALGDLPSGDVHVRDGAIVAVGTNLAAPGAEVVDGRNMIALPGLIDTHWHLWNSQARNLIADGPELGYFPVVMRLGQVYMPEDTYRGVMLGVAEAINSGVTTVHDWAHNVRSPADADADLRALADAGIRARFSYGFRHGHAVDQPMDRTDLARVQREWFAGGPTSRDGLLTLGICSRGHPALTQVHVAQADVLRGDWEHARSLGLPITLHGSAAGTGETLEDWLAADTQLVHGVNLNERDRAILAEKGVHLSVSPYSEARVTTVPPQITEMLAAGVLVSLSFDASGIAANADMFATIRMAVDLEHIRQRDVFALPPRQALELATINGAQDLGIADRVGSLTPGKRADLILVRTTDLNMAPLVDPIIALVDCAQPSNVDTVIVDGRILKRGGQLTAIDTAKVVAEAAESLAGLRARAGGP
jgi:cytosine/adenosine deaminase-related metal-dependent hydrolase